jgi:hypothetical protein
MPKFQAEVAWNQLSRQDKIHLMDSHFGGSFKAVSPMGQLEWPGRGLGSNEASGDTTLNNDVKGIRSRDGGGGEEGQEKRAHGRKETCGGRDCFGKLESGG